MPSIKGGEFRHDRYEGNRPDIPEAGPPHRGREPENDLIQFVQAHLNSVKALNNDCEPERQCNKVDMKNQNDKSKICLSG